MNHCNVMMGILFDFGKATCQNLHRVNGKNLCVRWISLSSLCNELNHDAERLEGEKAKEVSKFQNFLFDQKRKEMLTRKIPRIEKIEVKYVAGGISDNAVMYMNKNLSTPYHCAMHISRGVAEDAVLARVTPNYKEDSSGLPVVVSESEETLCAKKVAEPMLWDMHSELPFDCNLELLKFQMFQHQKDVHDEVNKAYWRSCAMLLGATLQEAFKEKYQLGLHRIPSVSVKTGAFCYDVILDDVLRDWKPTDDNLIFLTKVARGIISRKDKFQRLKVDVDVAKEIFQDDVFRLDRITQLTNDSTGGEVTLYRVGEFIDVVDGPMISDTSKIFHYVVTALHKITTQQGQVIHRVQGVSLPEKLQVHHAIWSMLENRARLLIKEELPSSSASDSTEILDFFKHKSIDNETKIYSKATGQWLTNRHLKESTPLDIAEEK